MCRHRRAVGRARDRLREQVLDAQGERDADLVRPDHVDVDADHVAGDVVGVDIDVIGADEVRVTLTLRVEYLFAKAIPGAADGTTVSAHATAVAVAG